MFNPPLIIVGQRMFSISGEMEKNSHKGGAGKVEELAES